MWLLPFIICQVYSCTSQLELLSMSALSFPLLLLPHSRASFSSADPNSVFWREFWSFSKHLQRVVLTSSSAVWNKHTHARTHTHTHSAPLQLLPWCSSAQCGKSTLYADICHIHLASSVKPNLPPNQIKLPRLFQLWVNERATALGQIVLMAGPYLPFAFIYSCAYSSILSCPLPHRWKEENPVWLHQVWSVSATTSGCTSGPEQSGIPHKCCTSWSMRTSSYIIRSLSSSLCHCQGGWRGNF